MRHRSSIKYTSAAIVWIVFVLLVLLLPVNQIQTPSAFSIPGLDKVVHVMLFAVLTFLIAMAVRERKVGISKFLLLVCLSLFGLCTEIIQDFMIDRTADSLDLLADVIGVGLVLLLIKSPLR